MKANFSDWVSLLQPRLLSFVWCEFKSYSDFSCIFSTLQPQPNLSYTRALAISFRDSFYYIESCALHQRKVWLTVKARGMVYCKCYKENNHVCRVFAHRSVIVYGCKSNALVCFYGGQRSCSGLLRFTLFSSGINVFLCYAADNARGNKWMVGDG